MTGRTVTLVDVQQRLDDIVATVEGARSMPMSASCVVNRAELLDMLGEVRQALPGSLAQAQELLGGREQMVAEARQEAQRIIEAAHNERGSLVSETEVARLSQQESERILTEARQEAAEIRAEADDYVDSKLANFEVVLSKTIGAVDRGRDKLLGRAAVGEDFAGEGDGGEEFADPRDRDPEVRRQQAEEYIEAQFRAFEAVLAKTLEAVGRGRQKLTGHRAIDELGAHMAAQSEALPSSQPQDSDADYLAGLVDDTPPSRAVPAPREPAPVTSDAYSADPHATGDYPRSYEQPAGYPQPAAAHLEGQGYPGEAGVYDTSGAGYRTDSAVPSSPDYYPAPDYQSHQYPESGYQGQQYASSDYQGQGYAPLEQYPNNQAYHPGGGYQDPEPYLGREQLGAEGLYPEQGYAPAQSGGYYPQQGHPDQHGPAQQGQQPAALDETSFFDTSMIDMDQLRRYEQGH